MSVSSFQCRQSVGDYVYIHWSAYLQYKYIPKVHKEKVNITKSNPDPRLSAALFGQFSNSLMFLQGVNVKH